MRLSDDLKSTRWIYAKGFLFLLLSMTAGLLLIVRVPQWQNLALLLICVWAACRAYYFAFYVIQHYVDPGYHFSGLLDFAKYVLLGRQDHEDS